jgi:Predicted membrane protein (DUF2306)
MTTTVWTDRPELSSVAGAALKFAARFWFAVAIAGQTIFLVYVAAFYGGAALAGNMKAWNGVGYRPGATMNNVAVAAHLVLAVVIMLGGPLQLIPKLRSYAPRFHHWNGRVYMLAVFLTSIAGLYMVWSKHKPAHLVPHIGISVDAVLIITFAALALRRAMQRDLGAHRRWALRLFMVVNAGWFFRVMLMFWVLVNRGPAGFDPESFTGPFINFISFADYLLPLAVLELYLRTNGSAGAGGRLALAGGLAILTVAMGIGIFAASMVMWLPRI